MVIWLKTNRQFAAVPDVIRAEDLARTVDLADAMAALDELVAGTMSDATAQANELIDKARRESDSFVLAARRRYENSARLGYASGLRRALAQVHGQLRAQAQSERDVLLASAERLARIVIKSVEQVVAETDRDALMRRVAMTVARAIDEATHLTVTVPPVDLERAERLFGALTQDAVPSLNIEVVADEDAEPDTCVCEWDSGVVEANLRAQVAGLTRALSQGVVLAAMDESSADDQDEAMDGESIHDESIDDEYDDDEDQGDMGWDDSHGSR